MKTTPVQVQPDATLQVEGKKTYEKPDIMFQAPLETMAAECPTTKNPEQVCTGTNYS